MGQSISLGPQGCNQPAAFHLTEALPSPGSQVSPAGSFPLSHARFWFLTHTLVCLTDILTAKSCALHLHPRAAIRGHWPCWAKEHWEVLISAAPLITAAPLSFAGSAPENWTSCPLFLGISKLCGHRVPLCLICSCIHLERILCSCKTTLDKVESTPPSSPTMKT